MQTNLAKGSLWLAVTILIWGAYMPVGKVVAQAIDPYWITGIRYAFSGMFLAVIVLSMEGPSALLPDRRDLATLILLGALGSAGFGLFSYLGVRLTRPEHAAAITVLTPINVAIFRAFEARSLPPRNVALAAIVVVFGAILVVTRGNLAALASGGSMIGNLLVFVSSLCWTFYTIKAQSMVGYSALRLTALTCLLGSPVGIALAFLMTGLGFAHAPHLSDFVPIWPQIVYLFILVSAVSIITWNTAVRAVGAQTATLASTFTPVIPFAWAWWMGRTFTAAELLGVLLIIGAIIAHNVAERRRAQQRGLVASPASSQRAAALD